MVWGWFKCITFIAHFVAIIVTSAPPQIIRHRSQRLGTLDIICKRLFNHIWILKKGTQNIIRKQNVIVLNDEIFLMLYLKEPMNIQGSCEMIFYIISHLGKYKFKSLWYTTKDLIEWVNFKEWQCKSLKPWNMKNGTPTLEKR